MVNHLLYLCSTNLFKKSNFWSSEIFLSSILFTSHTSLKHCFILLSKSLVYSLLDFDKALLTELIKLSCIFDNFNCQFQDSICSTLETTSGLFDKVQVI